MADLFSSFSTISTSMSSFQSVDKASDVSRSLFTSESTYGSGRILAKVGVDLFSVCSHKALPEDEIGKKYMNLQGDLGFDEYKALCEDAGLVLLNINYCQQSLSEMPSLKKLSEGSKDMSELEGQQLQGIMKMKSLINHDYLILEIRSNYAPLPKIFIKAEKASAPKPGIHIGAIPPEEISQVLHDGVKLFTIDIDCKIGMDDLRTALMKEKADYSLRNANCWDYAFATTKSVLKRCAEVPGLSADKKNKLLTEHDSVGSNLASRHIVNTVEKLIDRAGNLIQSAVAAIL